MRIVLNSKVLVWISLVLYAIIAAMAIQVEFAQIMSRTLTYSDGIFYIALDILLLYQIISKRYIYRNGFVIAISAVGILQLFSIVLSDKSTIFILLVRHVTWVLLLISLHMSIRKNPRLKDTVISSYSIVLLLLLVLVIINEFVVRNAGITGGLNTVYWIEMGLPLAFLTNNKKMKIALLCGIGIAVIASMKATALLAFVLPLLFAAFINSQSKKGKLTLSGLLLLAGMLLLFIMLPFIEDLINSVFEFDWSAKLSNSVESGGSGRFDIYNNVIGFQKNSTLTQWLFGHGFEGVQRATRSLSAHNDFLEVLYDYGLIALVPYLLAYFCMIKMARVLLVKNRQTGIALAISAIQFFVMSCFSHMVIYPRLLMACAIIWAVCAAEFDFSWKRRGVYHR